jgi:hypothetical protein
VKYKKTGKETKMEYDDPRDSDAIRWGYSVNKSCRVSPEKWQAMYDAQEGRCQICGKHQAEMKKAMCVDHDHKTGQVRGLLCTPCNTVIGMAHDDPKVLQKAILYLKRHRK